MKNKQFMRIGDGMHGKWMTERKYTRSRRVAVLGMWLWLLPAVALGQSSPKILVAGAPDSELAELRAAAPRATLVRVADEKAALAQVSDAHALINLCTRDLVRAGKNLRWVQVGSAGVEGYMFPELVQSNITLTNAKVIQGPEIADHAMALLLSLTRKISELVLRKSREEWPLQEYQLSSGKIPYRQRSVAVSCYCYWIRPTVGDGLGCPHLGVGGSTRLDSCLASDSRGDHRRESVPASATGPVSGKECKAKTANTGCETGAGSLEPVLPLDTSAGDRQAGHVHSLASSWVSTVLAMEVTPLRAPAATQEPASPDHHYGAGESELG
jgi:hypothetical protein